MSFQFGRVETNIGLIVMAKGIVVVKLLECKLGAGLCIVVVRMSEKITQHFSVFEVKMTQHFSVFENNMTLAVYGSGLESLN